MKRSPAGWRAWARAGASVSKSGYAAGSPISCRTASCTVQSHYSHSTVTVSQYSSRRSAELRLTVRMLLR
eukprot:4761936-Pyramimonas_sp.AAC.1